MIRRVAAWLNLAYRMAVHTAALPLRPFRGGGGDRFLATVRPEGYLPLPSAVRAGFPAHMRCISCGLCALATPELTTAPASAWAEPWTFVVGGSRSIDHAELVAAGLTDAQRDPAAAAVCPSRVPVARMAHIITALAGD